jgi:hypothetical protein
VGEMNGLLEVLTTGMARDDGKPKLGSPRLYTKFVQPGPYEPSNWRAAAPALPRPADAHKGSAVAESLLEAAPTVREEALAREVLYGNVPEFWRQFVAVPAEVNTGDGEPHRIVFRVSPDYLSVGSDEDFVRMPLTPYIAQHIADMLGCVLPTRKMVNDIYRAADAKLAPQPLTADRESLATFFQHHQSIQQAWLNREPRDLVAGIKKDVVVTNKLLERPDRVAIYGWHKPDGEPIQPLTTVHVDWYVDYSHGIRLVDQWCEVDGEAMRVEEVLRSKELCSLLSDEGPLETGNYRRPGK